MVSLGGTHCGHSCSSYAELIIYLSSSTGCPNIHCGKSTWQKPWYTQLFFRCFFKLISGQFFEEQKFTFSRSKFSVRRHKEKKQQQKQKKT